jgi:putative transposase
MVTSAMQLYFTGESLRNVQKFLKLQGVEITHVSIYNWIRKYVGLMKAYLEKITPNVADSWRADELYLKVRGNPKYLFALMDDQTRFWIAQQTQNIHLTSDHYFATLENWTTRDLTHS